MNNPAKDITNVVLNLCATESPTVQKAALEKYMTRDVEFKHPLCAVRSGPNSRDKVLGIFQWYRVFAPHVDIKVKHVAYDESQGVLYLEMVQFFKIFSLPINPKPASLVTRVKLRKQDDGLYYIYSQEDFYQPEELLRLSFPFAVPFATAFLSAGTFLSNTLAKGAQMLGYWRPQPI